MEKPNFERITQSFRQCKSLRDEIIIEGLINDWESISQREIDWIKISLLEDLLKEYEMDMFLPDFLLIGFHFIEKIKDHEKYRIEKPTKGDIYEAELFNALELLLNNDKDISIEIYRKQIHQVSIHNPILIRKIKEALHEKMEAGYTGRYYSEYQLDIKADWGKYIKGKLTKIKESSPRKGRPKENNQLKSMIFCLWNYLQNNTQLIADNGKTYSRRQARFIFSFLEIHKLIDQSITNKEDVIAYYLNTFKKSRNENLQRSFDISKARDLNKEKSDIEEFLAKYQKDYRLTSERKEDLLKRIGFLEKIIAKRNKL